MNTNGQSPAQLTDNQLTDLAPTWSPDGSKIAFARRDPDTFNVYAMDPDGQNQTALTKTAPGVGDNDQPAWR